MSCICEECSGTGEINCSHESHYISTLSECNLGCVNGTLVCEKCCGTGVLKPERINGELSTYKNKTGTNAESTDKYTEAVDHPAHYTAGKIEVIDFIEDQDLPYHLANAIKYICRCRYKGTQEQDIEKAIWYLKRWNGLNE
jgi:hypothetical protein